MALNWTLLLIFGFVRCNFFNAIKYEDNNQIFHDNDETEDILKMDHITLQIESDFFTIEARQHLKEALLHITYLDFVFKQVLVQVDMWEITGSLSSQLSSVSAAQLKDEDVSYLMDYILSTVKPFLNNSNVIADVGTALNMHNCAANRIIEGLQRKGPATLIINDDLATINFTITTNTISMSCDWEKWVFWRYYGIVSVSLKSITVETIVDLKLQPNQRPVIRKIEVKELGEFESDITGFGPFRSLVKTIVDKQIAAYRKIAIDFIENKFPLQIQNSLDRITLPEAKKIKSAFNKSTVSKIKNNIANSDINEEKSEMKKENSDMNKEEEESDQIMNPKFKYLKKGGKDNDDTKKEASEIEKSNSDINKEESDQIVYPKVKYLKDKKANNDINKEENEFKRKLKNEDHLLLENQIKIPTDEKTKM